MEKIKRYMSLNSFQLKLLAVILMTIDHIGAVFFPKVTLLRKIGRIAFPIFAFLLAEGFFHTSDVKKYIRRLGILALVSEVPFDLLFYGVPLYLGHQNVFFTLFLAAEAMYWMNRSYNPFTKVLIAVSAMLLADVLRTDYVSMGIILIFAFYFLRNRKKLKYFFSAASNLLLGGIEIYGALALLPISLYNGEEGMKVKPFFYLFYPVHMLVLFVLRILI